jgi:serine/threonine protein phosphatase 1
MNKNIYIISDVHGCYKTLLALIEQFPNKQNSKIVFVGDLIDKGINSCDVIEFVKNNNYDCVLGNHDEMMILYHSHLGVIPVINFINSTFYRFNCII